MLHCPRNIMRTISYSGLFLATCLAPVFSAPALAADPTGDWRVADGVANIRVAECNGSMWGAVSWEKTPGGRDKNNPDVSKQSRPTLGMPILIDMKKKPASINGKAKSTTPRTANSTVRRSSRSAPISSRSRAACWAFFAAAKPGPASPARFPRARPTAWPRARRRAHRAAVTQQPCHRRAEDHRLGTRPQDPRSEAGRASGRSGRRYLPTPRHRAVCPLAPAGTAAPRRAS